MRTWSMRTWRGALAWLASWLASPVVRAAVWWDRRRSYVHGRVRIRCPWHDERTPSCLVDEARGAYHCFGCGRYGDISDLGPDWRTRA